MFITNMVSKEKISTKDETYPLYDDATIERMKQYYRVDDHDELLRYIRTHGMRRHSEILD
jgi:hypothetical protein